MGAQSLCTNMESRIKVYCMAYAKEIKQATVKTFDIEASNTPPLRATLFGAHEYCRSTVHI